MNRRKKIIIITGVLFLLLTAAVFVFYFKSHDLKKIKGSVSEVPVNSSFSDMDFYSCVVNSYNKENGTNYLKTQNLSDEQLASIENLDCKYDNFENIDRNYINSSFDNEFKNLKFKAMNTYNYYEMTKIQINSYVVKDISGIEKLTGIKYADIYSEEGVSSIDLSSNTNLIDFSYSSDTSYGSGVLNYLNLSNNTKLENLSIKVGDIKELEGASNLASLKSFKIETSNSNLSLDLSFLNDLTNLTELYVDSESFSDLSLISNLTKLEKLTIIELDSSETKLNDLSYISNIKYLNYHGLDPLIRDSFPEMENLDTLILGDLYGYIESVGLLNIDFSNIPNLTFLSLNGLKANITKFSDLKNITSLDKLKYLSLDICIDVGYGSRYTLLKDLTGIENLVSLESLYVIGNTSNSINKDVIVPTQMENIKNVYGDFADYSKFPNLTGVYNIPSDRLSEINTSKLKELQLYDLSDEFLNNLENYDLSNVEFYSGRLTPDLLKILPNVKELGIDLRFYGERILDFSNNQKLEIFITYSAMGSISSYDVIGIDNLPNLKYFSTGSALSSYNFENSPNLESLLVLSTIYEAEAYLPLDFSNNPKLKYLYLRDARVNSVNLSENDNLEFLTLDYTDAPSLDISNCNKLKYASLHSNTFNQDYDILNLVNVPNKFLDFSLPKHYQFEFWDESSNEYLRVKDNMIISNKIGENRIRYVFYNMLPVDSNFSSIENAVPGEIVIISSNIAIDKYDYDANKNYLFTGTDTSEKEIISNIKQKGVNIISAVVDRRKLKLIQNKKLLKQLDIISVTSSKYDITNDNIEYNGEFDINNLYITNAVGEVSDNILKIKYNDEVVKEYVLIKKNNLLGDVNGDGEITISDIVMQYKHVKYTIDLEKEAEFRADINKDDDVSISDIPGLYKYIKGQTDSVGGEE